MGFRRLVGRPVGRFVDCRGPRGGHPSGSRGKSRIYRLRSDLGGYFDVLPSACRCGFGSGGGPGSDGVCLPLVRGHTRAEGDIARRRQIALGRPRFALVAYGTSQRASSIRCLFARARLLVVLLVLLVVLVLPMSVLLPMLLLQACALALRS